MPTNKLILVGVLVLAGLLTVVVLNTGSDPKPAVATAEKSTEKCPGQAQKSSGKRCERRYRG